MGRRPYCQSRMEVTTQAMDMDRVKLVGQVKEIKLTAALPVVPVAKVGPRTAAELFRNITLTM